MEELNYTWLLSWVPLVVVILSLGVAFKIAYKQLDKIRTNGYPDNVHEKGADIETDVHRAISFLQNKKDGRATRTAIVRGAVGFTKHSKKKMDYLENHLLGVGLISVIETTNKKDFPLQNKIEWKLNSFVPEEKQDNTNEVLELTSSLEKSVLILEEQNKKNNEYFAELSVEFEEKDKRIAFLEKELRETREEKSEPLKDIPIKGHVESDLEYAERVSKLTEEEGQLLEEDYNDKGTLSGEPYYAKLEIVNKIHNGKGLHLPNKTFYETPEGAMVDSSCCMCQKQTTWTRYGQSSHNRDQEVTEWYGSPTEYCSMDCWRKDLFFTRIHYISPVKADINRKILGDIVLGIAKTTNDKTTIKMSKTDIWKLRRPKKQKQKVGNGNPRLFWQWGLEDAYDDKGNYDKYVVYN